MKPVNSSQVTQLYRNVAHVLEHVPRQTATELSCDGSIPYRLLRVVFNGGCKSMHTATRKNLRAALPRGDAEVLKWKPDSDEVSQATDP
jgi:hypothetical protein